MPNDNKTQAKPFIKQLTASIIIPTIINDMPPNRWLFFQVVSFFILQFVLNPMQEFIRNFGIMFPMIIIDTPKIPKMS